MTPRGQMSAGANQRPPLSDLPPNMKMMFEPRPPVEHKPLLEKRKMPPYTGIAQFVQAFETTPAPPKDTFETPKERKARQHEELKKLHLEKLDLVAQEWDPALNRNATENAYHTLFVGRLSYEMNEKKIRREFEQFGPVLDVKVVRDRAGKHRGYGFVEFEREEDMTSAYKRADGKKLDGRRVVVDVERGRTVRGWRPRRLGGGLGGRKDKKSKKTMEEERAAAVLAQEAANRAALAAGTVPTPRAAPVSAASDRDRDRDRERERDRGGSTGKYGPTSGGDAKYGPGPGASPPRGDRKRDRSRDRDRERDSKRRSRSRDRDRSDRDRRR